ncbi:MULTISPECIES: cysteine desulfurase family protein [Flavobacterium]|uniref:cysteine desulfurase n=1 Tax=Flavobacterium cutihirudinis TaxID=1265740 RepID=A0A3D9G1D1_9FLAO|nr:MULTISPECIES: cysteine desulfurase family protein [Flavobacterium]MBZ4040951.1 cysteine desulfurase [Flavobacterium hibisci]RED27015.1 cysteine desulfurase IscS [Flavobacterium cutihirudinis]
MNNELIYLDNNSTTAIDDRVIEAMYPYFKNNYGNASSTHHFGLAAKKIVENSREIVSSLINSDPKEIIFTSGATESINIALKGIALDPNNSKRHIITLQTEHKAVLDTCKFLETVGFEIEYLPVNPNGLIDIENLILSIRQDTLLVCIMWVNNETGVIQPIKEISTITNSKKVLLMTDATQAVGKLPINITEFNHIDLLCFSAHKFYGPKGIGALYINQETVSPRQIFPIQHGGGHERGLRSGTLNVPAIVGFAKACEIASLEMTENTTYIKSLRDILEIELLNIRGVFINGSKEHRLYNTINACFPNFDANMFIDRYQTIAVSNGSACTSALFEPSHVLLAMGLNDTDAFSAIRFSLSNKNTEQEILTVISSIKETLIQLAN